MNMITNRIKQNISAGSCNGTIGSGVAFNSSLVEYKQQNFPLPHGEAHVMFARQRAPDYTTKEINLSFSKELPAGRYELRPESHAVRLSFADNSAPSKPVIYQQISGAADLAFDEDTGVFSGTLDVVVENNDDDDKKTLTINVEFVAKSNITSTRISYSFTQAA